MSSNSALLSSDWKVLLDGVEIPHQGFNIEFVKNQLSRGMINLEPDFALVKLRPQTVVTIFANDQYPEDDINFATERDRVLNRYYLYWEGLTTGVTYSKSPTTRLVRLNCESMFGPWTRAKAFAFGVGAYAKSNVLSGSLEVNPNDDIGQDVYSLTALAEETAKNDNRDFATRVIEATAKLCSLNANTRLQTTRYNLFNKISGVADNSFSNLIGPMALGLFTYSVQVLNEQSSVFGVLNHYQQYAFFSNYELPAPVPQAVEEGEAQISQGQGPLYAYPRKFKRTQLMLLPETYFLMPPPCNLIFPDDIRSLTVDRSYYTESTRTLVEDPHAVGSDYTFYLAPPSIIRNLTASDRGALGAGELVGLVTSSISTTDTDLTSPYQTKIGDAIFSSFLANSNEELEKGIVASLESYPFESLAAQAKSENSDDSFVKAYQSFMTAVAEYRHNLASYNRVMSLELNGVRDLAPGFTAAVFDSDITYLAHVESISLSVDPLGTETTSVTLNKARPLTFVDYSELDKVVSKVKEISNRAIFDLENADLPRIPLTSKTPLTGIQVQARILEIEQNAAREVQSILQPLKEQFDIPLPPAFLNQELSDLRELDKLYQTLLGCKPLYTSKYTTDELADTFNPGGGSELAAATAELGTLYSYATATTTLNNIFKMGETQRVFSKGSTAALESWQDVNNREDVLGINTHEWANRNFLRRKRLPLSGFLSNHDLQLDEHISTGITRKVFYSLVPTALEGNPEGWDDTIFSKLVLDRGDDPIIGTLRQNAPDHFKTGFRQQLIREYSIRHFGSRAFNG